MAEIITINGEQYKKRSPWGIWGLVFLTLGVYYFIWYYKINDEARRYLRDESIQPVLALLALFVPLVNIYSTYRTGERVARMEAQAGIQRPAEPVLAAIAALFVSLIVPYLQTHLNGVWDASQDAHIGQLPPAAPAVPPAVPPPPPPPAE